MNWMDQAEEAYKNGYAAGKKDAIKAIRSVSPGKREKVIENLRAMSSIAANNGDIQSLRTIDDALALLKEQEPRVMTLEELLDVGRVWESSAPPYLWLDKNRSIYNTISFWCAWRDIYEMIHGRHDKYTVENYGSEWRCWTSHPTPDQMRDTKWEEADNG